MRLVPAQSKSSVHKTSVRKKGVFGRQRTHTISSGKKKKKLINRSTKRYFSQMVVGSLVFLGAFLFLAGYTLYNYLHQTFASASSLSSYSVSNERVVALSFIEAESINSDPIILKSLKYMIFDEENKELSVFDIPLKLKVDMTGKFGEEEIYKAFALGALNSKTPVDDGVAAVNKAVKRIFGYKVDRYVFVDESSSQLLLDSLTGSGFSELLSLRAAADLKKDTLSNLTAAEYYNLAAFARDVGKDKISNYSVTQSDIDDSENLDSQILDINFDGPISIEGLSVSILNGTDIPGVALFGSRLVKNSGGRVVGASNASLSYDTSYIVTDIKDSSTLNYISRVLGISNVLTKMEAEKFNENEVDRSDITVIVGFDTAGALY